MTNRIVLFVLVGMIFQFVMSSPAAAQTTDPCLQISTWYFPDPPPLGWYYYAAYPAPFVYLIATRKATPSCAPPPENHCPKCEGGRPIQFSDGNTYIDQTDVELPGLGGGLTLRRRWNSTWPLREIGSSIGMFGPQWRSTYEERAFISQDYWIEYSRSDGSFVFYAFYPSTAPVSFQSFLQTGLADPSPVLWTLYLPNGEQRQFDNLTGHLTAITDRNGNKTQLAYDTHGRLSTVTDPASRHLYFNYPGDSSYLVTSVTSDFGISLTYAYDGQGRLSQVTRPDLTTISFTYDAQSNITAVIDQNGKILESHTYNANGQGLTSSQANGVNAITVTYP